jgi:hypothetical protein
MKTITEPKFIRVIPDNIATSHLTGLYAVVVTATIIMIVAPLAIKFFI